MLSYPGPGPINSVVRTTGLDEPFNCVMPCWTGVEECHAMGVMLSCPGPGPMSRSTELFVHLGWMSRSTV